MGFQKGNHGNPKWQKGVSGNPGGRARIPVEVVEAARQYTLQAIETLKTIMLNPKIVASARVQAASILIDRGWGKAPQTVTLRRDEGDLKDLSDAELIAIAAGTAGEGAQPNGSGNGAAAPGDPDKPH